jgi:hypothetical protein
LDFRISPTDRVAIRVISFLILFVFNAGGVLEKTTLALADAVGD